MVSTENIKCNEIEVTGVSLQSLLLPEGISFKYSFEIDNKTWVISGDYCKDSCDNNSEDFGFDLTVKIDKYKCSSDGSCHYPFSECILGTKGLPLDIQEEYEENLYSIFGIIEMTLVEYIEIKMMKLLMTKHLPQTK